MVAEMIRKLGELISARLDIRTARFSLHWRRDAAEAALIRDLATDKTKSEMFDCLHHHFNRLADEVEQAMAISTSKE